MFCIIEHNAVFVILNKCVHNVQSWITTSISLFLSLSFFLSFLPSFLHSLHPSLSVSWTSCSVALKHNVLSRFGDHSSALSAECDVNDMIHRSKATFTSLFLRIFQHRGLLRLWNVCNVPFHVTLLDDAVLKTCLKIWFFKEISQGLFISVY